MRGRLPLLRRARRALPARRRSSTRDRRRARRASTSSRSGAVLAVMPWNFPFWQVIRFAAPALAAGNVGAAQARVERPAVRAGARGSVPRAPARRRACSRRCWSAPTRCRRSIADPRVAAVTLTGSEGAGRASRPRPATHLKKTVLELGGSDPFIVHAQRRPRRARSRRRCKARTSTTASRASPPSASSSPTRSTTASRRAFVAAMARCASAIRWRPTTELGPLATARSATALAAQVERSVAAGARLLAGGRRLDGPGYFYQPTVLADVPRDGAGLPEELFGPVAALFRAADADDAIRSPTPRPSAWAPASGRATARRPSASPRARGRHASSSTAWSPPTRASPSAA